MRDLSTLPDLELALIQTTLAWQDAAANREHFAKCLSLADEFVDRIASEGFNVEDGKNILDLARSRIDRGVRACAVANLPIDRLSRTDDQSPQGTART